MKRIRIVLLFIVATTFLLLVACNQNAEGTKEMGETNNNGLQQVSYKGNNQQMEPELLGNENNNPLHQSTQTVPIDGVQKINNGFITIDQNSYSTTIPSEQFPHSQYLQQGQFEFYADTGRTGGDIQKNQQAEKRYAQNNEIQNKLGQKRSATEQPQQQVQEPAPEQPQQSLQRPTPEQPKQQAQAPVTEQPKEQVTTQGPANETAPEQNIETKGITSVESRVIQLTNEERRKNGLPDLQADTALSNVAREKSNDMQQNNYFSHTSPTYGSPFDMMRDFGISYQSAGENIAQGQRTPEEVVNAWMNSEGHRKNILTSGYTHIGVGYNENGHYWTQMFISK